MKGGAGNDHLALAWEYSGKVLEVIPAKFSLSSAPEITCSMDESCGATLQTWTGISGTSITDLKAGTKDFTNAPNYSTRITNTLEVPENVGDNYGSRMNGWLRPPVTGEFVFWIAADDLGEFWLSTDSDPANKGLLCHVPGPVSKYFYDAYPQQIAIPTPLIAGRAYYYEVRCNVIFPT
jgi:hypothetical protein